MVIPATHTNGNGSVHTTDTPRPLPRLMKLGQLFDEWQEDAQAAP